MASVSLRLEDAVCARNRPSFAPKSRYGPTTARVLASRLGALTALRMTPSTSAARTACAISMPTDSCASAVLAPRCGVNTIFGCERNGKSAGGGSTSNTSSAAPATCPLSSAASSAPSSISPPRAQLTIRTPGLHSASRRASSMCLVSGVSGMCMEMKSARGSASSSWSTSSTCKARARLAAM